MMSAGGRKLLGLLLILLIIAVAFLLLTLVSGTMLSDRDIDFSLSRKDKVGVIEVRGVIEISEPFIETLDDFADDDDIKAVVIRVDSPGGGASPSQEIYEEIRKFREKTGKPVVVSMAGIAASGGYYISCAADSIIATPGTLTGSIGVILEFMNVEEALDKIGISFQSIVSGEEKDIGSPFREMTEKDREILQGVVSDVYDQFLNAVAEGRGLEVDSIRPFADGRIMTGRQALEIGLVDRLGSLRDAIDTAGKMAGLGDKPEIKYPPEKKKNILDRLVTQAGKIATGLEKYPSMRLMYVYR